MSIIVLIIGIGFLMFGIRHNPKVHEVEGFGGSDSILWDLLALWLDKLPYWVTKIIYILIGLGCLFVSFFVYR
ncbi:hypothetical protein ACFVT8_14580 [Lysinibacillus sp. NPDC058147]|uniref:hypothetical protein n=1 Tax=unclassified Lysinibacillus TaxID=2636778 RepID=UPI0036D75D83